MCLADAFIIGATPSDLCNGLDFAAVGTGGHIDTSATVCIPSKKNFASNGGRSVLMPNDVTNSVASVIVARVTAWFANPNINRTTTKKQEPTPNERKQNIAVEI